jgi:hypothetical protein
MTYTFDKAWLGEITSHIIAYSIDIVSLVLNGDMYTLQLSQSLDAEQFEHLQEHYELEIE